MEDRSRIVRAFTDLADLLEAERQSVLAALNQVETFKTARVELEKTVRALRTYDRELPLLKGRSGLGVTAVMLPFNTPLYSFVLYAFGPLLSGNVVRVRPSALTGHVLRSLWGLMAPVLRSLPVSLSDASGSRFIQEALRTDPVGCFIFTGAWENIGRILPELSESVKCVYSGAGVNPFVVLRDADVEKAIAAAVSSRIFNSGQDCLASERFYIAREVYDEFLGGLLAAIEQLKVGPLTDPNVDVGPVVSASIAEHVMDLLNVSRGHGSLVHCGTVYGPLVYPAVVSTAQHDPIVRAEKFAAVFPLVSFGSVAEMVDYVDDCQYALGVSVFGGSTEGMRFAAPHVAHNRTLIEVEEEDAHVPFGGERQSGFVQHHGLRRGGPILFSLETSTSGE